VARHYHPPGSYLQSYDTTGSLRFKALSLSSPRSKRVYAFGISSGEQFGNFTAKGPQYLIPSGIGSSALVGVPHVGFQGLESILVNGRLMLQSDNGLWYWLKLSTEDGITTTEVDQVDEVPPFSGLGYVVLESTDFQRYRLSLFTENGSTTTQVEQVQTVENGVPYVLLISDDAHFYRVSLYTENGITDVQVNQIFDL
jgi:hypothetical protein